jgi:hypothetical protein
MTYLTELPSGFVAKLFLNPFNVFKQHVAHGDIFNTTMSVLKSTPCWALDCGHQPCHGTAPLSSPPPVVTGIPQVCLIPRPQCLALTMVLVPSNWPITALTKFFI